MSVLFQPTTSAPGRTLRDAHRRIRPGGILLTAAAALLLAACGPDRPNSSRNTAAEPSAPNVAATETAPATARFSVDSIVHLRGRVVLGHEVRAFIPEGDTVEYWIVDRSGALEREYDRKTGGQKNGMPARAELKARCKGPTDEGFAAGYEGVFEVVEVLSVEKAEE